jgi:hypothetical protein
VKRKENVKPYCIVQFESNEFVTKESIHTEEGEWGKPGEQRKHTTWKHEAVL